MVTESIPIGGTVPDITIPDDLISTRITDYETIKDVTNEDSIDSEQSIIETSTPSEYSTDEEDSQVTETVPIGTTTNVYDSSSSGVTNKDVTAPEDLLTTRITDSEITKKVTEGDSYDTETPIIETSTPRDSTDTEIVSATEIIPTRTTSGDLSPIAVTEKDTAVTDELISTRITDSEIIKEVTEGTSFDTTGTPIIETSTPSDSSTDTEIVSATEIVPTGTTSGGLSPIAVTEKDTSKTDEPISTRITDSEMMKEFTEGTSFDTETPIIETSTQSDLSTDTEIVSSTEIVPTGTTSGDLSHIAVTEKETAVTDELISTRITDSEIMTEVTDGGDLYDTETPIIETSTPSDLSTNTEIVSATEIVPTRTTSGDLSPIAVTEKDTAVTDELISTRITDSEIMKEVTEGTSFDTETPIIETSTPNDLSTDTEIVSVTEIVSTGTTSGDLSPIAVTEKETAVTDELISTRITDSEIMTEVTDGGDLYDTEATNIGTSTPSDLSTDTKAFSATEIDPTRTTASGDLSSISVTEKDTTVTDDQISTRITDPEINPDVTDIEGVTDSPFIETDSTTEYINSSTISLTSEQTISKAPETKPSTDFEQTLAVDLETTDKTIPSSIITESSLSTDEIESTTPQIHISEETATEDETEIEAEIYSSTKNPIISETTPSTPGSITSDPTVESGDEITESSATVSSDVTNTVDLADRTSSVTESPLQPTDENVDGFASDQDVDITTPATDEGPDISVTESISMKPIAPANATTSESVSSTSLTTTESSQDLTTVQDPQVFTSDDTSKLTTVDSLETKTSSAGGVTPTDSSVAEDITTEGTIATRDGELVTIGHEDETDSDTTETHGATSDTEPETTTPSMVTTSKLSVSEEVDITSSTVTASSATTKTPISSSSVTDSSVSSETISSESQTSSEAATKSTQYQTDAPTESPFDITDENESTDEISTKDNTGMTSIAPSLGVENLITESVSVNETTEEKEQNTSTVSSQSSTTRIPTGSTSEVVIDHSPKMPPSSSTELGTSAATVQPLTESEIETSTSSTEASSADKTTVASTESSLPAKEESEITKEFVSTRVTSPEGEIEDEKTDSATTITPEVIGGESSSATQAPSIGTEASVTEGISTIIDNNISSSKTTPKDSNISEIVPTTESSTVTSKDKTEASTETTVSSGSSTTIATVSDTTVLTTPSSPPPLYQTPSQGSGITGYTSAFPPFPGGLFTSQQTTMRTPSTTDFILGPGACMFDGKVYVSAQQILRDDPCDFCFCFRGDIICLQQSCPPPVPGCFEEPIPGFCCPRYECPLTKAVVNITTTTTPIPTFPSLQTTKEFIMCEIGERYYHEGEVVEEASGPCLECR